MSTDAELTVNVLAVFFALTWAALITLLVTLLVLVKLKVIAVKVLRKPRLPSFSTRPSCRICKPGKRPT